MVSYCDARLGENHGYWPELRPYALGDIPLLIVLRWGLLQFCVRIVALLHVCLRGHSAVTLNFWLLQGKKLKGPDWYRSNITAINHEILYAFHSKD